MNCIKSAAPKRAFLITSLVILISAVSMADQLPRSCSSTHYRGELGPVWNQTMTHDPGWCTSYAAADLLSYKLKKRVSPLSLALTFNDVAEIRNSSAMAWEVGGGNIKSVVSHGLAAGLCSSGKVVSRDFDVSHLAGVGKENTVAILRLIAQVKTRFDQNQNNFSSDDVRLVNLIFPGIDASTLISIMRGDRKSDFIYDLRRVACAGGDIAGTEGLSPKQVNIGSANSESDVLGTLDLQLDKGNIVGIQYNSILMESRLRQQAETDNGPHASTIIDRRIGKAKDSCEYLIRNSWGPYVTGPHGKFYADGLEVEQGNIWVSEDLLLKMLIGIVYLD